MDNGTTPYVLSNLDITVATIYIVEAVIFIFLHLVCNYLIITDKEMRNPTYYFMLNLSIVDIVSLTFIGIYAGTVILTRWHNDTVARVAAGFTISAWYSNCVLFALISFARWIALTKPHLTPVIFTRRTLWTLQALAWLLMGLVNFYANVIYTAGPTFPFMPELYTWGYDPASPLGQILPHVDVTFSAVGTLFEMMFNVLSLRWVHQTRKQVQCISTVENRRREVKLLIQCFFLNCVFTAAYITFTVVYAFPSLVSVGTCLIIQTIWTTNHSVNPIVYFCVNRKLRRRAKNLLFCGKFSGAQVYPVKITGPPA